MAKKAAAQAPVAAPRLKPFALADTSGICCGGNLEQFWQPPDAG